MSFLLPSFTLWIFFFSRPAQINLSYPSWAGQSPLAHTVEGVAMSLPQHQAAAPALPMDQSCLPEESVSASRAHGGTLPEFMESVIDSVSADVTSQHLHQDEPKFSAQCSRGIT